MFAIADFDRSEDLNARDIYEGERTLVLDLLDARASGGNGGGKILEATGTIRNGGGEASEATIGDEAVLDDSAEDCEIDVAAAKNECDTFAA